MDRSVEISHFYPLNSETNHYTSDVRMDFENRGGKTRILVLRHMNEQTKEGMNRERDRTVRRGGVPLKAEEERMVGKQAGSKEGFGIRGQHSQPW